MLGKCLTLLFVILKGTKNVLSVYTTTLIRSEQITVVILLFRYIYFSPCRTKVDVNREVDEAAQNNPIAIQVYNRYHQLIQTVSNEIRRGILFDLHGQVSYDDDDDGVCCCYVSCAVDWFDPHSIGHCPWSSHGRIRGQHPSF